MVEDALAGKIDLIITKSVSRFARNTVDTLTTMQDARVGACATQYFSPENMIKVEIYPDGHYEYSTGGRHRIAAAQELGIEIPVQINEYGNKDGFSISPWEKQERYDALMNYMKEHNYSESDRAIYEADPEWQRLNKAFNHPVNEWEHQELSDWEESADALLKKRYEELHSAENADVHEQHVHDTYYVDESGNRYPKVIHMDKRLADICGDYSGERYRQLLYCVCVRYIRKAALETPAILSETEFSRVLNRAMGIRSTLRNT